MVNINFYDLFYLEIVLPNSVLVLACDRYWSSTSDRRDWAGSSRTEACKSAQFAYSRVPIVEVPTD